MKISFRLQEDQQQELQHHRNPLIKAKVPITIFNQPFTSSIATVPSTSSSSHLSFSLSSNFSSGPSLRLSYSHTSITPSPFSLSLKSGLGLFGSPNNSPLVFTAHFSLSHTNPTFSLHIKPQFGNFSLKKSTFSDPNFKQISGPSSTGDAQTESGFLSNGDFGNGFVSAGSSGWQELRLEPFGGKDGVVGSEFRDNYGAHSGGGIESVGDNRLGWKDNGKDGFLSGIAVMARTVLPLTKNVAVNMRWGVNFPAKFGKTMPYLTVNKIGIERIEEEKVEAKKSGERNVGDMELLKGMCLWMRRDLEVMEKENREVKQWLEEMKFGISKRVFHRENETVGKRVFPPSGETSSGFEQWRKKKSVREENAPSAAKESTNPASDLESELQRAIKAATTA